MISEVAFENLYTQVNRVERDNAVMKTEFTSRFVKIDTVFTSRFDAMDKQFNAMDKQFSSIDKQMEDIAKGKRWLIGTFVTVVIGFIGILIAIVIGFASIVIPMMNDKEKQQIQPQVPAINNYYQIPQGHEIKPKK